MRFGIALFNPAVIMPRRDASALQESRCREVLILSASGCSSMYQPSGVPSSAGIPMPPRR